MNTARLDYTPRGYRKLSKREDAGTLSPDLVEQLAEMRDRIQTNAGKLGEYDYFKDSLGRLKGWQEPFLPQLRASRKRRLRTDKQGRKRLQIKIGGRWKWADEIRMNDGSPPSVQSGSKTIYSLCQPGTPDYVVEGLRRYLPRMSEPLPYGYDSLRGGA